MNSITIRTTIYRVEGLMSSIRNGKLILEDKPSRWTEANSADFIASLLQCIPTSGLYVLELTGERRAVLDGSERLRALQNYFMSPAFDALETFYKNRLEDTWIILHSVAGDTSQKDLDILIKRVNYGK